MDNGHKFEYNGLDLLTLWENCTILEQQLRDVKDRMSEKDRKLLECYLTMRIEFEKESYKASLQNL